MTFKPVSVADYEILKPFFCNHPYHLSIYSLASLISWSYRTFKAYYAIEKGILYIAGQSEEKPDTRHLILPISRKKVFTPAELRDVAVRLGFDRYWYAPGDYLDTLDRSALENCFVLEEQKEFEDYVYLAEELTHLKGNRFSKKRNLIHQFSREYLWRDRIKVEEIVPENAEECLRFLEIWCEQHECSGEDQENNLVCERNAIIITIKNMARLESKGILIRIDGKVSAFGIGSRLNDTTAVLNFEKADSQIKGLYQFLDNECAKRLFAGFQYINKESDMNIPNLAESKQSYHPVLRVKSYALGVR